jgi:hypothetical protein
LKVEFDDYRETYNTRLAIARITGVEAGMLSEVLHSRQNVSLRQSLASQVRRLSPGVAITPTARCFPYLGRIFSCALVSVRYAESGNMPCCALLFDLDDDNVDDAYRNDRWRRRWLAKRSNPPNDYTRRIVREHAFAPCHLISTMISNNDANLIIHTPLTRSH